MSVNKVILLGNVGAEPDVHYFDSNSRIVKILLATSDRGYTMSNGTQIPERTEWHTIILSGQLAAYAETSIHKSMQLYVEGKLRTRSYEDKTGIRRYVTEIFADQLQIINRREAPRTNTPETKKSEPLSSEVTISGPDTEII